MSNTNDATKENKDQVYEQSHAMDVRFELIKMDCMNKPLYYCFICIEYKECLLKGGKRQETSDGHLGIQLACSNKDVTLDSLSG